MSVIEHRGLIYGLRPRCLDHSLSSVAHGVRRRSGSTQLPLDQRFGMMVAGQPLRVDQDRPNFACWFLLQLFGEKSAGSRDLPPRSAIASAGDVLVMAPYLVIDATL
jgi:hypothetical protein